MTTSLLEVPEVSANTEPMSMDRTADLTVCCVYEIICV